MIEPAIRGTIKILESAVKAPFVKRIVIIFSVIAVILWEDYIVKESEHVFSPDDRMPNTTGPYGNYFHAYAASRTNTMNATARLAELEKPHFDVINMLLSLFNGRSELVTEAKDILQGTNGAAFGQVFSKKIGSANPGTIIYVNDVAEIHILALAPKVNGNQNFVASSGCNDDHT